MYGNHVRRRKQVNVEEYSIYFLCLLLFQLLRQNTQQKHLEERRACFGWHFEDSVHHDGECMQQSLRLHVACCRDSQEAETGILYSPPFPCSIKWHPHWMVPPTSINPKLRFLYRHAQKFVSKMTLDTVKLTVKISLDASSVEVTLMIFSGHMFYVPVIAVSLWDEEPIVVKGTLTLIICISSSG